MPQPARTGAPLLRIAGGTPMIGHPPQKTVRLARQPVTNVGRLSRLDETRWNVEQDGRGKTQPLRFAANSQAGFIHACPGEGRDA